MEGTKKEQKYIRKIKNIDGEFIIDIPQEIIEKLNLKPGDILNYEIKDNCIIYMKKKYKN